MPSRKPAKPVVVDGIEWLAVIRPDAGHVCFGEAVKALRSRGEQFDERDVNPGFLVLEDNGTYQLTRPSNRQAIVGWVLR